MYFTSTIMKLEIGATTKERRIITMKYTRQFGIILAITFVAELLKTWIPLPIPASIYGLLLMLLLLHFKIIKLNQIKETALFLIEIMPMMFIPAAVGLLVTFPSLKSILIPVLIITIVTTVFVMAVTGKITQYMIRLRKEEKE